MMIKRIIMKSALMLALLAGMGAKLPAQNTPHEDSIIVISEDDLIKDLSNAVMQYQKSRNQTFQINGIKLTPNDMRLIKLQMLLNSLGTFDRPQQPQTVYVGKDQNGNDLYTIPQPQSYSRPNVPLVYPQSGSTYIPVPSQGQTRTVVIPNPVGGALQSGIALAETDKTDKEIESLRNRLNLLEAVKRNQLAGNNNVHQLNPQLIDGQVNFPQSDIVVINNERLAPYFKRQVFFRQGSNILDNRSKETLDEVIKLLKKDEMSTLILTGYASPEGAKKFNVELTERRSKAVRQYLSDNGITSDRLRIGDGNIDHTAGIPTVARRVDLTVARKL